MSGEVLSLPSFGKINLHLQVIGRRPDGFHDLCTVFQTISLHDTITVSQGSEIELTCSDPSMPVGERNIMVRAANLLREEFGHEEARGSVSKKEYRLRAVWAAVRRTPRSCCLR